MDVIHGETAIAVHVHAVALYVGYQGPDPGLHMLLGLKFSGCRDWVRGLHGLARVQRNQLERAMFCNNELLLSGMFGGVESILRASFPEERRW